MGRFASGIVTYNPDIKRLGDNIAAVSKQTEKLYLVDNGSSNIAEIRLLLGSNSDVTLIENNENSGIARALNQLCRIAESNGYEWLLTMDQDSVAYENLMESYLQYVDFEDVAIICPCVDDDNENNVFSTPVDPFSYIDRCITSSSLTKLSVWKEIGGFDEKMFIDCVDFDYCTRVIGSGYKIIRDNNTFVHHRLGEAIEIRFFIPLGRIFKKQKWIKPIYTYNHSPKRTYYYARNIKYYMYKNRDLIDIKKEKKVYFRWLVLKLAFEPQRFKKLKAIIKGNKDSRKMIKELNKNI